MDITDLNTAITQLNSAITQMNSATTSLTAVDLSKIASTLSTVSTNLQNVINEFPSYNDVSGKITTLETSSTNSKKVVSNLRTVLGQVVALQNMFFGGDTTAPAVHGNSNATTFSLADYAVDATGDLTKSSGSSPTVDALKKAVPSYYDLMSVAVAMYQMIIGHSHYYDETSFRALAVSTEASQVASLLKNIKPSSNSTAAPNSTALDTTTTL